MGAEEPINSAHEFNCNEFCQELSKLSFNLQVFVEVNEVVDVDTKGKRCCGGRRCWVGWINDVASEEAQV